MGVTTNQRTALRARLDAIAGAPPSNQRALEKQMPAFRPTIGTPWLRETLAPYASSLESIPPQGGLVENESLYLLDYMVPIGTDVDTADAVADGIVAGYPPGFDLIANGQTVRILSSKREKSVDDLPNWFFIPITIKVRANTRNPG
jgi:hypothetical protein